MKRIASEGMRGIRALGRWRRTGGWLLLGWVALEAAEGSFDVTLWNAGRNLAEMPGEWGELFSGNVELAVIIESGSFSDGEWKRFVARNPDVEWTRYQGGITVGVRGKTISTMEHGDGSRFRCRKVEVEIGGKRYGVVAVDIPSQPWLNRERYLRKIMKAAEDERSLILGDFNTPPDAHGFDAWGKTHRLANGYAGRGFMETWAHGVPLLTLDQLWLSRDLACADLRKYPGFTSDHSRMVFTVSAVRR